MSNKIVRVILTFVNPTPQDIKRVNAILQESITLTENRLYITSADRNLVHYSSEPKESVRVLDNINKPSIKPNALGYDIYY